MAVVPTIRTRFDLAVSPETISIVDRDSPNFFESRRTNSSFAAPSTGGEFNFTFRAPLYSPAISLFDDRGMTRTSNVTEPLFSEMLIAIGGRLRKRDVTELLYAGKPLDIEEEMSARNPYPSPNFCFCLYRNYFRSINLSAQSES
jgi:hypothetical protein